MNTANDNPSVGTGCDSVVYKAAGYNELPIAMRCFYESDSYTSFIHNVFSLECDCDTLCAIGGAVAEEFYRGTGLKEDKIMRYYLDDRLYGILKGEMP